MLTISKNQRDLFGAIEAGADGYLLKNAEPEELRKSLLLVMDEKSVLSPEITGDVMRVVRESIQTSDLKSPLTSREEDILKCLAQGMTTKQVAEALIISDNTVKTHVRNLLEKLGASNRAEAVSMAVQMGLIKT
jgi:DNA-binding NarL/FixJ family response regulator